MWKIYINRRFSQLILEFKRFKEEFEKGLELNMK